MSEVRAFCVVTASGSEVRAGDLGRFLASVMESPFQVVVVLRDGEAEVAQTLASHPSVIRVINTPVVGLSRARNLGIAWLRDYGIEGSDVVSFPDDDCTYPGFLYSQMSAAIENWDLIVGGFSNDPKPEETLIRPLRMIDVWYRVASVGVFVRWKVVARLSGFDEGLGVGSGNIEAGEDIDFVARAIASGFACALTEGINVQHPIESVMDPARGGAYVAVARLHSRSSVVANYVLFKALVAVLLPSRQLSLKIYWHNMSSKRIIKCRQFLGEQSGGEPAPKLNRL